MTAIFSLCILPGIICQILDPPGCHWETGWKDPEGRRRRGGGGVGWGGGSWEDDRQGQETLGREDQHRADN